MHPNRHSDWQACYGDWHKGDESAARTVVDSRPRMRLCLAAFVVLLTVVFGRVVQLEVTQGAAFRSEAAKPLVRRHSLPGVRGRILARNGTVLARDKKLLALAVHYRWLEEPPNRRWLRSLARSRLAGAERKDPERVAAEEAQVRAERAELARRLARLSGLSSDQWRRRARRIQTRVERIAGSVNRRHQAELGRRTTRSPGSLLGRIRAHVVDVLRASLDEPPDRITVAEELEYHVICEDVPLALVAEVETNPQRYPGVKVVLRPRRIYPAGRLAAHVLGHLGPVEPQKLEEGDRQDAYHPQDRRGRMGLELQYERLLRGRRGVVVEVTDRSGRVLYSYRQREPQLGRDLVLCLDPQLQHAAEGLLESALQRRAIRIARAEPAGGAILVMNVHTGEILTAASAPGFDPNLFAGVEKGVRNLFCAAPSGPFREKVPDTFSRVSEVLHDPGRPLFDRATKMAIPPGSLFKTVAAVALLEAAAIDPDEKFFCRGYLYQPDRWRCAIHARHGIGHGEITLADALCESCNVYFFDRVGRIGPEPLVDWARRFGFGRPTGVDLPGEASGTLPTPSTIRELEGHAWRNGDTRLLAIGQGSLQVTPIQVVRMMAAIANGGLLVTPHVVSRLALPALADGQSAADLPELADDPIRIAPPRPIPGLRARTLAQIREGLKRVVSHARGTAHDTVHLDLIPIAGKTGTAQTGAGRAEHAWFAGYVPADEPELAFVVVLEHAGNTPEAAGPVAKRLVRKMHQLGYFQRSPLRRSGLALRQ